MNEKRKIINAFLHFLLLPVYCFLELGGFAPWVVLIVFFPSLIVRYPLSLIIGTVLFGFIWYFIGVGLGWILFKVKDIEFVYELVKTGENTSYKTHYHDVSINGQTGYYTTREKVVSDSFSPTSESIKTLTLYLTFFTFAVLIWSIKLVLSVIACFTNKFDIVIRKPQGSNFGRKSYGFFFFGYVKNKAYFKVK